MRHSTPLAALLTVLTLTAGSASAQDRAGRYSMSPTEGGVLRLDTESGSVSFCSRRGGDWSCAPVAESRPPVDQEIARLEAENKELKAEVKRLEALMNLDLDKEPKTGVPRPEGEKRADRPGFKLDLPSEQDVDKALSYVERMYKKFRDKMKEMQRESPGRTPGGSEL